jgi:hypothetical protein
MIAIYGFKKMIAIYGCFVYYCVHEANLQLLKIKPRIKDCNAESMLDLAQQSTYKTAAACRCHGAVTTDINQAMHPFHGFLAGCSDSDL